MYEHLNGRPPPGSTTDLPESDDSAARLFPARLFFILDTATQLVSTVRKIKDKETRELVRLRRKNAVRWMLRLKVAFGPLWDPRKNRRGSQAVCRCLCHLYSAVAQCYEAMRQEVVTILPFFAFWAEEDLISENWFEGHVISGDGKRSSLTNRELATITRPIEQAADHIDHLISNLRDMVWREFKDWPRHVRSPAALDPSPRVQKTPPALPRSPTPEAATNGPIPESPADRIELAAAAPSENGTAATGGTPLAGSSRVPEAPAELPDLVTLDQAAASVHRKKRTLEHYKTKGSLPAPTIEGGGGKPDLWEWRVIRPWLEAEFKMSLPEDSYSRLGR